MLQVEASVQEDSCGGLTTRAGEPTLGELPLSPDRAVRSLTRKEPPMSRPAFSRVPSSTWIAFNDTLSREPWSAIETLSIDTPEARLALIDAPVLPAHKAWLRVSILNLAALLQADPLDLQALDDTWDEALRALHFGLSAAELSVAPEPRAAAARLRDTLFRGEGTGIVRATYAEEVTFGRYQIQLAQEPNIQRDLATTQLQPAMQRVESATLALEQALSQAPAARNKRSLRAATTTCAQAAANLYDHLALLEAQLGADAPASITALKQSLETLR